MATSASSGRVYRGLSPEDRLAERRRRLIDTARELFGTHGYAATRIADVCAGAGVTTRHFYETFAGREELLVTVYQEVAAQHVGAFAAALAEAPEELEARVRAGLQAAVDDWVADPAGARISVIEIVGVSPLLEEHRIRTIEAFAQAVADDLDGLAERGLLERRDRHWQLLGLVGAVSEVLAIWLHRGMEPPVEQLVDELVALFVPGLR